MTNLFTQIRDHLNEGRFLEACHFFNNIDDDEVFEPIARRYPALLDYDAKGNWVGNEKAGY